MYAMFFLTHCAQVSDSYKHVGASVATATNKVI